MIGAAGTGIWFVEERTALGRYVPALYHTGSTPPTERRVEGGKRLFREDPQQVARGHEDLTLHQLVARYGVEGHLRATTRDVRRERAEV